MPIVRLQAVTAIAKPSNIFFMLTSLFEALEVPALRVIDSGEDAGFPLPLTARFAVEKSLLYSSPARVELALNELLFC